jgi:hypothetical protein
LIRATKRPDRGIGDTGVKRRGVEFGMTQERLNHANIDILLEEVRGEAVPQRVRRHAFLIPAAWAVARTARQS